MKCIYGEYPQAKWKNRIIMLMIANIRLEPFLVVKCDLHFDPIRHPRTNEILAEPMYVEGTKIIDLGKGKILDEDDPISEHLGRYYQNAVSNTPITEKGFTIKKIETIDNGKVLVNRIKNQVASENVRRVDYLDGKQERVEKVQAAKSDKVHTLIHKVYLPIWEVIFKLGGNVYKRTYFAYDGDSIYDEMKNCKICKKQTSYVCKNVALQSAIHMRKVVEYVQLFYVRNVRLLAWIVNLDFVNLINLKHHVASVI